MGLFGVFKKKKEPEKIRFSKLEAWVLNKKNQMNEQEQEILKEIDKKTSQFLIKIKGDLEILEQADLSKKKVEEKIKLTARENLENYIYHVKNFIENLKELKEEKFENFISKANEIFSEFDKKSYMNYQKATFLIGKEIETIKESIQGLSKYFKKVFKQNKEFIDTSQLLSLTKQKLKEIEENNEIANRSNKRLIDWDEKITNTKESNKKTLEEIEKIKQSKEYLENVKRKQDISSLKTEIDQEVNKLRGVIDFKALSNIFHVVKEKNEIIKAHKEEFAKHFHKDNGASILELIAEFNPETQQISTKINNIKDKKEQIIKIEKTIEKDKTQPLFLKIKELSLESDHLAKEKEKELKAYERLKIKKQESKEAVKQNLSDLDVIVVGD
jgi:hypothetical protein